MNPETARSFTHLLGTGQDGVFLTLTLFILLAFLVGVWLGGPKAGMFLVVLAIVIFGVLCIQAGGLKSALAGFLLIASAVVLMLVVVFPGINYFSRSDSGYDESGQQYLRAGTFVSLGSTSSDRSPASLPGFSSQKHQQLELGRERFLRGED